MFKATHATIYATELRPGYRAIIFNGEKELATAHFTIPREFRVKRFGKGCDRAYAAAKKYAAGFGVK